MACHDTRAAQCLVIPTRRSSPRVSKIIEAAPGCFVSINPTRFPQPLTRPTMLKNICKDHRRAMSDS